MTALAPGVPVDQHDFDAGTLGPDELVLTLPKPGVKARGFIP